MRKTISLVSVTLTEMKPLQVYKWIKREKTFLMLGMFAMATYIASHP